MSLSSFQFTQPLLTKAVFEMGAPAEKPDTNVSVHLNRNIAKIEGKNQSLVELSVQLNKQGNTVKDNALFYADFTMQALFSWQDDISDDQAQDLLSLNAPTLLLSYIRPLIATITAAAPIPQYNLPYINMVELFKQNPEPANAETKDLQGNDTE